MEDKAILIIENAIKLFAKKGYSTTSVQEIANECDISKGAFYLHFKSKDALLLEVFNHYSRQIQLKSDEIQATDLDPRTKFVKQLTVTYQEIIKHRDFIIMQIREQAIPFNKDIEDFMQHMRFNSYLFYKRNLLAIYGKEIDQTIWEVTLLMQGMFKAYLDLIIIEGVELDVEQLCESILRRADYLVEGFNRTGDKPVINDDIMNRVIPDDYYYNQLYTIVETLREMKTDTNEDIEVTISVLLEEIQKEQPRLAVIKGMLSNLEEEDRFKGVSGQIRTFFQI
ncbi:TetR/AcrR family transcriptional regulator; helix-turn-helix transcriptional regulator [Halobacillus sp. A1]|uniref:TetR/AcrR family transcriptional regulator n=1 Tax=Halobacillus sp. A1 TaxID=2880262 RepID=UPI0020A65841|nr:TetR/AcrR family transcriptional regulator [Halobacillus sp. A1]MCP3031029.1 TetR/AcrR family transcriptional regulator; helix-turn-helix transcriptional regulator [Halobacillus sp. A1]